MDGVPSPQHPAFGTHSRMGWSEVITFPFMWRLHFIGCPEKPEKGKGSAMRPQLLTQEDKGCTSIINGQNTRHGGSGSTDGDLAARFQSSQTLRKSKAWGNLSNGAPRGKVATNPASYRRKWVEVKEKWDSMWSHPSSKGKGLCYQIQWKDDQKHSYRLLLYLQRMKH